MSEKKLKSIAFDLDTKALQEYYPKDDWRSAYNDMGNFLNKHDFVRMQGSVYDSTTKFSDDELGVLVLKMSDTLTWLPHCVKSIRGYDQPVMIDYTQQLRDNAAQDLELVNKKEKSAESQSVSPKAMESMKQKIKKFEESGRLDEITSKRDKGKDKER